MNFPPKFLVQGAVETIDSESRFLLFLVFLIMQLLPLNISPLPSYAAAPSSTGGTVTCNMLLPARGPVAVRRLQPDPAAAGHYRAFEEECGCSLFPFHS